MQRTYHDRFDAMLVAQSVWYTFSRISATKTETKWSINCKLCLRHTFGIYVIVITKNWFGKFYLFIFIYIDFQLTISNYFKTTCLISVWNTFLFRWTYFVKCYMFADCMNFKTLSRAVNICRYFCISYQRFIIFSECRFDHRLMPSWIC